MRSGADEREQELVVVTTSETEGRDNQNQTKVSGK